MESGRTVMAFLLWDKKIKIFLWQKPHKYTMSLPGENPVNTGFLQGKFAKNKKIEIFLKKYLHFRKRWCILNESTAKSERQINKWPVGQGVKTSPSHGENTGSIPVLAATK